MIPILYTADHAECGVALVSVTPEAKHGLVTTTNPTKV
jgi:hypothetical protein